MKIIKSKISLKFIILFSISLLGFYFLNLYTSIRGDDFSYKFIFNISREAGLRGVRVESISDLFTSMYNHYFVQNGRILLNGLAQLFLMPENKLWFNVVNTLLFGLFQFLLLKRSNTLKIANEFQYLVLVLFLWFLIPNPNFTFLWLTGTINYVWGIILVLLFLDLFDKVNSKDYQVRSIYLPLFLLVGFIAGFTHEVFTIGVSVALCIGLVKQFKKYKRSALILIFGFLLGTFIMIIAPGNMVRFSDRTVEDVSIFYLVLQRFNALIINFKSLSAFWILIVLFFVLYIKDRSGLKEIYKQHELILHAIFISFVFLFAVGAYFPPRAYFGISVFSIIIIMSIINQYYRFCFKKRNKIIYTFLIVFLIVEFTQVIGELKENTDITKKDEANWLQSDDKVFALSKKNINRFSLPIFINAEEDLSDRFSWASKNLSWYYDKDFMMLISGELYQNVYSSNEFLINENLLNTESLKQSSKDIKLYKTVKNNFILYRLPDSISKKIVNNARVEYISNRIIKYQRPGFFNRFKNLIGADPLSSIRTELKVCFVLPTPHGTYLVLNSPKAIPFENIENILIYPSQNDTIPILNF